MAKGPRLRSRTIPVQASSTAVARLAGVSQSTVSRVFSESGAAVSPELSKRVLDAAKKLGYTPNALPAILQTGRSGLVGVVLDAFSDPGIAARLTELAARLRDRKLEMIVTQRASDEHLNDVVERLSRYRIDEIINLSGSSAAVPSRRRKRGASSAS